MHPFLILAIGMAVVIGGILALRLHAFLALVLAALIVSAIAAPDAIYRSQFKPEDRDALFGPDRPLEEMIPENANLEGQKLALIGKHAAAVEKADETTFMGRVAAGLGNGFSKLAILIAMAAIIGKCLLDSGGAERIVVTLRNCFGERRTPIALTASSFTLGIPVFFDTVFYLLMPLAKALRVQTGKNYLLYILAVVCGGTMAHSLVPPTPGPLLVATELGVDIGVMMIAGLIVGLFTVSFGFGYAVWANRRWEIPLRPSAELSEEDLEAMADRDESQLPPFWLSILPIVLPVVLIAGQTIAKSQGFKSTFLATVGDKNMALIIAAAVAMILLVVAKGRSLKELSEAVGLALASGGVILLITSAGSAFGGALRDTGIADEVAKLVPEQQSLMLIPIAWLITIAVRTAQGSATVAMITAIGIVAPIVGAVDLAFHPVYIALAVGCGSKPIMWANDSGFWIIGRMSGMTPLETFKTASVQMIVMSLVGLIVVLVGAMVVPMVVST